MSGVKPSMPKISLIVACLIPEYGIGYQGQLSWSLKQEMKYFRKLTTTTVDPNKRNVVIMGRKTYYSIPPKFRPLKGRINIVLTRNKEALETEMAIELDEHKDDLFVSSSLNHALEELKDFDKAEEIFIIGGAEVYNQLLSHSSELIDRIFLTEVKTTSQLPMDAFFKLDNKKWKKTDHLLQYLETKNLHNEFETEGNEEGEFKYDFTLWEKVK